MKSDYIIDYWNRPHGWRLFRQISVTLVFLLFTFLRVDAKDYPKDKITIKLQSAELKKALTSIERLSDYHFLYNQSLVANKPKVSIDVADAEIGTVLNVLLVNTGITYKNRQHHHWLYKQSRLVER